MALAMLDSAGSALQGFEDISSSVTRNFKSKPKAPGHDHRFQRFESWRLSKRNHPNISQPSARAGPHGGGADRRPSQHPEDVGDRTVRPLDDVNDFPSGLKAGGKVSF